MELKKGQNTMQIAHRASLDAAYRAGLEAQIRGDNRASCSYASSDHERIAEFLRGWDAAQDVCGEASRAARNLRRRANTKSASTLSGSLRQQLANLEREATGQYAAAQTHDFCAAQARALAKAAEDQSYVLATKIFRAEKPESVTANETKHIAPVSITPVDAPLEHHPLPNPPGHMPGPIPSRGWLGMGA